MRNRWGLVCLSFVLFNSLAMAQQTAPADQPGKPQPAQGVAEAKPTPSAEQLRYAFNSLWFTTVPTGLLICVFLWLVRREGWQKFEPFFGQGQLAQLVVIVIVTGNVCSLAIMGLLGSSEIGTIYGGIVGYVLGRRVSRQAPQNNHRAAKSKPGEEESGD